ncbi:hypothetical protein LEP1GSC106_2366 [Leptospira interrogans serovar Grippotyphosa str. UI 12764]|nr:hypothetical protein LEP1GSC106_2366 [Leptospira interrogans serovar Grippotyphosa str. UI 12764]
MHKKHKNIININLKTSSILKTIKPLFNKIFKKLILHLFCFIETVHLKNSIHLNYEIFQ